MEWIERLYGTTVGLDTAPLIYFIERLHLVYPFFESVQRGEFHIVTSTLTLTEVLVHPYRRGGFALVDRYSRMLLTSQNFETLSVPPEIASEAARLGASYKIKTPYSIQMATTIHGRATAILSNDAELCMIPGIERILLEPLLPFA
jgi:predicted nucleic acid-binding protein